MKRLALLATVLLFLLPGSIAAQGRDLESEAYVMKQWEAQAASHIGRWMRQYGAGRASDSASDSDWRMSEHVFLIGDTSDGRGNRRNYTIFSSPSYTDAKVEYGETRTLQEDKVDVEGFSRVFDNRAGEVDTDEVISESVTLGSQVVHELAIGFSAEMTSQTTVTGGMSGVEFEQQIGITLGTTIDSSQTEQESRDQERSVEHSLTVGAGTRVQVAFEANQITTETPFCVEGRFDIAVRVDFEDWACDNWGDGNHHPCHDLFGGGSNQGGNEFNFSTIIDLERFVKGYDPEHPDMAHDSLPGDVAEGLEWVFDPENRKIEACGTKRRVYSDNVDIVTRVLE